MCLWEELKYKLNDKVETSRNSRRLELIHEFSSKIVPKESAIVLGYPSQSLHADHGDICKYEDKDDTNYQKIPQSPPALGQRFKEH